MKKNNGYWVILLKNVNPKRVLCKGGPSGYIFKSPFCRGKIRGKICRWNKSDEAETVCKNLNYLGFKHKLKVVSYPSLWH
jgi:hypothetical protein